MDGAGGALDTTAGVTQWPVVINCHITPRIGQMQYSFAPPRTNAVQFWVSGTSSIELTYRTDGRLEHI